MDTTAFVQQVFLVRIDGRRRLVEDGEGRRVIKQPSEANALSLPARKHVVPLQVTRVQTHAGHAAVHELTEASHAKTRLDAFVLRLRLHRRSAGRRRSGRAPGRPVASPPRGFLFRLLGRRDVRIYNLISQGTLQEVRTLRKPHHHLPPGARRRGRGLHRTLERGP